MKNILQICTTGEIGGMERIVCGLTRGLAAQGQHVQALFPQQGSDENLMSWCRQQGVDAIQADCVLPVLLPHTRRDMKALIKLVQRNKPDIVHLHYGSNFLSLKDVLAVRAAGRHRCVTSVHNSESWDVLGQKKRWMTRIAAFFCSAVVANSSATREALLEAGIPRRKVHVVPCGVSVPRHKPSREEARSRLGLPSSAFIVGAAARLVTRKRVTVLIKAASRVPDPDGRLLVVVAGDGPERANCEALAESCMNGRVLFLGQVADVDTFYAACDVFALPSVTEGFGVVYLEAAYHSVPSIGCNDAGAQDAIQDQVTGLLVPPDESLALSHAIQSLRDDTSLRQRLGETARKRVEAEFTEQAMAERYLQILQN